MKAIKTVVLVVLLLIPAINVHAELIQPQTNPESPYEVLYSGSNSITLRVNSEIFTIASSFSMPNGTWTPAYNSTGFFNHTRTVEQRNGYIHITDTFQNISGTNLPLMQQHTSDLAGRGVKAWCAGRPANIQYGNIIIEESKNPTSYAITDRAGIGFMALSDEMQVHVKNWSSLMVDWYKLSRILGMADNHCVIPPGKSYSAEWVIVPTQRPDFWDFVNACRRIRNVNFTLSHNFTFLTANTSWDDFNLVKTVRNKSANVVATGLLGQYIGTAKYAAHGTLFQKYLESYPYTYANHNDRVRRLLPDVKPLLYFHAYLDNSNPEDLTDYTDDRVLLLDGTQATYGGKERPRIFFPTEVNKWGAAMVKNMDSILGFNTGDCKADGVYWDAIDYGSLAAKYHYGDPWDGISGDIDDKTGKLLRLKSSTILLGRRWIVSQIQRIMNQGKLITNSPPQIRSLYDLHYQSFVETFAEWSYTDSLLYSPVALGNATTDITLIDAYRGMIKALNYGCLYHWYLPWIQPEHVTLTKYMFPITPIELHEGYIIGEERIVTNRSGSFGWGDNSVHEVHVFNDKGDEVRCVKAPITTTKNINGNIYTELQLAEGWTAAIIRHPADWKGPIGYCPPIVPMLNLLLD